MIKAAVERAGVDPAEVEDVLLGCAMPEGATGGNIARQAAVRAGLPVSTGGATVNRFCSSGLQTIAMAAQRVIVDRVPVMVAGGVESISCVQATTNTNYVTDEWLNQNKPEIYWPMLQTAENVAKRYGIPKEAQDEYGVQSQLRAAAARAAGQVRRRDRADDGDRRRARQGHRRDADEGSDGQGRRGHPPRHHARRRGEDPLGGAGRRGHRRQREPVLRRRVGAAW